MTQRIRIIKLAERERQAEARIAKRLASVSHIAQEKARDATVTIMGWIGESQQHKRNRSGAAHRFKSLFEDRK